MAGKFLPHVAIHAAQRLSAAVVPDPIGRLLSRAHRVVGKNLKEFRYLLKPYAQLLDQRFHLLAVLPDRIGQLLWGTAHRDHA